MKETRLHLSDRIGQKVKVLARFQRLRGAKCGTRPAGLFTDVRDVNNRALCEHVWMLLRQDDAVMLSRGGSQKMYFIQCTVTRYDDKQAEWSVDGWVQTYRCGLDKPHFFGMLPRWASKLLSAEAREMAA